MTRFVIAGSSALARVAGRPAIARMPVWVLRVAVGELAPEVLGSLRVVPARLAEAGFGFAHTGAGSALRDALA